MPYRIQILLQKNSTHFFPSSTHRITGRVWSPTESPPSSRRGQMSSLLWRGCMTPAQLRQAGKGPRTRWHPSKGAEGLCPWTLPSASLTLLRILRDRNYTYPLENRHHNTCVQETLANWTQSLPPCRPHIDYNEVPGELLLNTNLNITTPQLDLLQFAYKATRGMEDVVACLLHTTLQHVDFPGHISSCLIHLIHNFLSDRKQAVSVDTTISSSITINTGAPQGCVLSPFFYTLWVYTNNCTSQSPTPLYLKYSDDTAIISLLTDNNSIQDHHNSISHFH